VRQRGIKVGGVGTEMEPFVVHLTAEQDALIRHAAEVEGTDLATFTVAATLAHARDVPADQRIREILGYLH